MSEEHNFLRQKAAEIRQLIEEDEKEEGEKIHMRKVRGFCPANDEVFYDDTRQYIARKIQQQNDEIQHPNDEIQHPNDEIQHPNYEIQHPNDEIQHHNDEIQHSNDEIQHLNDEIQHPNDEIQHPNDEIQHPNDEIQHPNDEIQHPNDEIQQEVNEEANNMKIGNDEVGSKIMADKSTQIDTQKEHIDLFIRMKKHITELNKCIPEIDSVLTATEKKIADLFEVAGLNHLFEVFTKYGFELRICGGTVRDYCLQITPVDIDLATNASINEMKELFDKENIKVLKLIQDRTFIIRVEHQNFDVSTLKGKTWEEDSLRRDFTINAMYMDRNGIIYDYHKGKEHMNEVKFVGCPKKRILEDPLRILRYFRFGGKTEDNVLIENAHTLTTIPGERIWNEIKKMTFCQLRKIFELGISRYMGFPSDCRSFDDSSQDFMTSISSVLRNKSDVQRLRNTLKISNKEYIFAQNYVDSSNVISA